MLGNPRMLRALCAQESHPYKGTLTPLKTARYSTVDAAFPRACGLLAYESTPRTPQSRESRRLNGTLTRLTNECWRTKFFRMRWEKSWVYKKAEITRFGFPLFLSAQSASILILFLLKISHFPNTSNCRRQYGLIQKRRGYTRAE